MNSYIIIILGWAIGQLLAACFESWMLEKANPTLDFKAAFASYFMKGQGAFVTSMVALLAVLFCFPDLKGGTDKEIATWKEWVFNRLRYISIVYGAFCQYLISLFFGLGKKIIKDKGLKNGIDVETNP